MLQKLGRTVHSCRRRPRVPTEGKHDANNLEQRLHGLAPHQWLITRNRSFGCYFCSLASRWLHLHERKSFACWCAPSPTAIPKLLNHSPLLQRAERWINAQIAVLHVAAYVVRCAADGQASCSLKSHHAGSALLSALQQALYYSTHSLFHFRYTQYLTTDSLATCAGRCDRACQNCCSCSCCSSGKKSSKQEVEENEMQADAVKQKAAISTQPDAVKGMTPDPSRTSNLPSNV